MANRYRVPVEGEVEKFCGWVVVMVALLGGSRVCHPKKGHFTILIFVSSRHLINSKCKETLCFEFPLSV